MVVKTKNLVTTVAFLIGIRKDELNKLYGDECSSLIAELESNKDALIIRYLCKLRTTLMKNFKKTDDSIRYEFCNINAQSWYDTDNIEYLEKAGIKIVLINKRANDYSQHFNALIVNYINYCRYLFPDWVEWNYIKSLFVFPRYNNTQASKSEFEKYISNIDYYPYQSYIYWKPKNCGYLLSNDEKFLKVVYELNGTQFHDYKKYINASEDVKESIYDFIQKSSKVVMVVDCENSDVYKLYGMIKNLNQDEIKKIHKVMLFDDKNTNSGWDHLSKFVGVEVEHIEVERVVGRKSLVDFRLTAEILKQFYQYNVSSFILLSSDSDYWALISSMPEIEFLMVIEDSKCGQPIKDALTSKGVYYCSLDEFCTANIDELKRAVLISELKKYFPNELIGKNGKEIVDDIYLKAGIEAEKNEKNNFYEKYVKTLKLNFDSEGNISVAINN